MKEDKTHIEKMLKSSDKETIYLGVCLIRKNPSLGINLLNTVSLENRIHSYEDVCEELSIKPLVIEDFSFLSEVIRRKQFAKAKLEQIAQLFNEDWIVDLRNSNQQKWFPYFEVTGSGLVFLRSAHGRGHFDGAVAYFKTEAISDFVGTLFIDLYKEAY